MTPGVRDKTPVLFIGESHCLAFDGLTATHTASATPFIARSHFLAKVVASNVTDDNSILHPHLLDVLAPISRSGSGDAPRPGAPPPLVLSFGDVEIHTKLLIKMADVYDFELPQRPDLPINPSAQAVPCSTVASFLQETLRPVREGIRAMHQKGFDEIILLGLPARAKSDKRASWWTRRVVCPLATRIKVTWLANAMVNTIAEEENARYIDTWSETSQSGVLNPKYDLDGVHTTTHAAQIAFDKIVDGVVKGRI